MQIVLTPDEFDRIDAEARSKGALVVTFDGARNRTYVAFLPRQRPRTVRSLVDLYWLLRAFVTRIEIEQVAG